MEENKMESTTVERDVDIDQALGDQDLAAETPAGPQPQPDPPAPEPEQPAPAPEPDAKSEDPDPMEILDIATGEPKSWILKDKYGNEKEYVQKPLSFHGKMEFFALLGDAISKMMEGPDGMSLQKMLSTLSGVDGNIAISGEALAKADNFVEGISKLSMNAPELLQDCFCIWLNIPKSERAWARTVMLAPVDEGGFSDEAGFGIIDTFLAQNWEALGDFFSKRVRELAAKVQARRNKKD